jgi:hypothetical protein
MISVAVKIETECGTCKMPMPVNTLAREVGCQSCGRPTEVSDDVWQALLRDPVYDGPRMLRNERRQSAARKLSAAYTRRSPCCQGCEKEISLASIVEVREQAMLRCDRCAGQTWVRAVPVELAGALPNITHLVGEDPDPPAAAQASATEAATFPCPQCGSTVAFDGVNRAYTCRFCNASVHVPDEFVYRGRRKVAASWFLCFDPSVADGAPPAQAVAAGLFDWEEAPLAAVDAEGNLYCAARQTRWVPGKDGYPKEETDNVLWSVDASLNVRWLQRGRAKAVHIVLSPKGTLLVSDRWKSSQPWLSCRIGAPVEAAEGAAGEISGELLDCKDLACENDGSLLALKDDSLLRLPPEGVAMPAWPDSAAHGPAECLPGVMRIACGPDGSIYYLYSGELARIGKNGCGLYRVNLSSDPSSPQCRALGVDLGGNAYVLCSEQVVRVSAMGEQRVVLESSRDELPRPEMSIAVCPDGSFWLFGRKGRAWKFDVDGKMLFVSEKAPRPKKPKRQDIIAASFAVTMETVQKEQEQHRRAEEELRQAQYRKDRPWIVAVVTIVATAVLSSIGYAIWLVASHP